MCPKARKTAVVKSLTEEEHVTKVRLLGVGELPFHQYEGVLVIHLPEEMPTAYANALEISF